MALRRGYYLEDSACIQHNEADEPWVACLVPLKDGSFISGSNDGTIKRWVIKDGGDDNLGLQLVGSFHGYSPSEYETVVERDEDGAIITLEGMAMRVWNPTTGECIEKIPMEVDSWCMVKSKNNESLVFGREDGRIEFRRINDLHKTTVNLDIYGKRDYYRGLREQLHSVVVLCVRELSDGTFVSSFGSQDTIIRWNDTGRLWQRLMAIRLSTSRIVELKSDIIVSGSYNIFQIWRLSTRTCLHTETLKEGRITGLVRLKEGIFVCGTEKSIKVYDENGKCLETHPTQGVVTAVATISGRYVVEAGRDYIGVRRIVR